MLCGAACVMLPAAFTASNCIGPSISSDGANSLAISVASLTCTMNRGEKVGVRERGGRMRLAVPRMLACLLTLSIIGPVLLSPVA